MWTLDLGMLSPSDLQPAGSKNAKALHTVTALASFYVLLRDQGSGHSSGAFRGGLAGCERDVQRLSATALTFLTKASPCLPLYATAGFTTCCWQ